jgi:outer membrane biosynthesis protein TonB
MADGDQSQGGKEAEATLEGLPSPVAARLEDAGLNSRQAVAEALAGGEDAFLELPGIGPATLETVQAWLAETAPGGAAEAERQTAGGEPPREEATAPPEEAPEENEEETDNGSDETDKTDEDDKDQQTEKEEPEQPAAGEPQEPEESEEETKHADETEPSQAGGDAHDALRLSEAHLAEGQREAAQDQAARALELFEAAQNQAGIADSHEQLAIVALLRAAYGTARDHYRQALALRRELDDEAGVREIQRQVALLDQLQGR